MARRQRLGEMLVEHGHLDSLQLMSALAHQQRWGGRLGHNVVQLGFLREEVILGVLGEQLGVDFVEIGDRVIPRQVLALVPERLVRMRKALPLERRADGRRGPLVVALADPADLGVLDEIEFVTGLDVRPVLAAEADLDRAISRHFDGARASPLARRASGFAARQDAIDLPEDTSPLSGLRGAAGRHRG